MRPSYSIEKQGALRSLEVSRRPCMSPACSCDGCHINIPFCQLQICSYAAPQDGAPVPHILIGHAPSVSSCSMHSDHKQIQTGLGHSKSPTVPAMVGGISRTTLSSDFTPELEATFQTYLLLPLPNALSIPSCFLFCFSLVSCEVLACHTPSKDIKKF